MDKRICKLLENKINKFEVKISTNINSANDAVFKIFDTFFHIIDGDKEKAETLGVDLICPLYSNSICVDFNVTEDSFSNEGISFLFKFDGVLFTIKLKKYRDGANMKYNVSVKSNEVTKYSGTFIYNYLLYCGLETSELKGSYFTMPRNKFSWDCKDIEKRSFDDIFLPDEIMDNLKLYVNIFKKSNKILRYLKVGNPGVGKTESTIVIANELNKQGVTVIKTPICEYLHEKVQLANVLAPSLIILDDLDLSLGDRNSGSYSQLLGDFLDVMDGTDKLADNVGVIATTNAAHLLDLAAQRPGRFDKTLLYNDLTFDNIRNIILKSLKLNFDDITNEDIDIYSDDAIVSLFHMSGVSGSHIFNAIKMLKLRNNTLETENVSVEMIVNSIKSEVKVIDEVRKISFLKEKFDRSSSSTGFQVDNKTSGLNFGAIPVKTSGE